MRVSKIARDTKETKIKLEINLDGNGERDISIKGAGFFEHMMELFAVHGDFDLKLNCDGDVQVDLHHTVEDIGICLGKAIQEALGDKVGIKRYSTIAIPMDEALSTVTIDISGRPFLAYNVDIDGKTGDFDVELVEEFFRAVTTYGGITMHITNNAGLNRHHIIESIFKAFARTLSDASRIVSDKLPSSKGVLE